MPNLAEIIKMIMLGPRIGSPGMLPPTQGVNPNLPRIGGLELPIPGTGGVYGPPGGQPPVQPTPQRQGGILGNPQAMGGIAQLLMAGLGGRNGGYMAQGAANAQQQSLENTMKQQQLQQQGEYQKGLTEDRDIARSQSAKVQLETRLQNAMKLILEEGMEADAAAQMVGIEDIPTLNRLKGIKAEHDRLKKENTFYLHQVTGVPVDATDPNAIAYDKRVISPMKAKIEIINTRKASNPPLYQVDGNYNITKLPEGSDEGGMTYAEARKMVSDREKGPTYPEGNEVTMPKSNIPIPARWNSQKGTWEDPTTGKPLPGAIRYNRPSAAMQTNDAMQPVIDRVAHSLAGVDSEGKSVDPDFTAIKTISSLRGDQRLILYDRIKQLNPKYDTASIDRKIKLLDYFQVGKGRENLQSLDQFLQHAAEVVDISHSIYNTDSRLANKSLNWWRENMGSSPELKRLETALEPAQKEFESYLLGGRALYSEDRKMMQTIVSPTSTINEIYAAVNQMGKTVKERYIAQNHSFNREMGTDLKDAFSNEGITAAQKIGIDLAGQQVDSQYKLQQNPVTKEFRHSNDGGKTWLPGK